MFRPTRRQLRQANWEASNPAYVFVYGTLKSGGASHEHITASEGIYYGEAEIQGIQLYLTPAMFPAAIDDPNGFARGEIGTSSTCITWIVWKVTATCIGVNVVPLR